MRNCGADDVDGFVPYGVLGGDTRIDRNQLECAYNFVTSRIPVYVLTYTRIQPGEIETDWSVNYQL